ncbi:MAG: SRPBCC family protein [Caldimonas sp.]
MRLLLAALLVAAPSLGAAQDVHVRVQRHGENVVVDVETTVDAPLHDAWSVFTDYNHMARFLTNIKESKVVAGSGNALEVEQAGETRIMFMRFGFKAVRAVELLPMQEIRSSLVSGDFKSYASTTRFAATEAGVRVTHHGEYAPKSWLPPGVGPMVIETETRKQYREFIAEIERRRSPAPGS